MSNIDSICTGLQSTRIKDRNDSLLLLEELLLSPSPSSSLTPKQYTYIISLTFKLIELEKKLYIKSSTVNTAIEVRVVSAANCIKRIIENSIRTKKNGSTGERGRLKYKHYQLIFNEIKSLLPIDSSTLFWPCSLELVHIINISLQQNFVNEHLGNKDWLQMFRFVVRTIETILEGKTPGKGIGNSDENILLELLQCLNNLAMADASTSIYPLVMPEDKVYFLILPVLCKISKIMKKEGALTVNLLKLINKLIMVLSTGDIYFVNKVILVGISILVSFSNSKLLSLQFQMFTFLNLDGVHDYIDLSNLPKMNSNEGSRADISIRSDSEDETDDFLKDFEPEGEVSMDFKVLQYSVGVLIQSFFNSISQPGFQLSSDTISLFANTDQSSITWFNLSSIYFNNNMNNAESEVISWLLNLGLSKLVTTFFRLKIFAPSSHSPSSKATPEPSRVKRQKLDLVQQALQDSNSLIEFVTKILNSKPAFDIQKSSLQILVFHLQEQKQLDPKSKNESMESVLVKETNGQNSSSSEEIFSTNSILDIDTTILNAAFEINNDNNGASHSKNSLIHTLLNSYDATNEYLFLLTFQSVVEDRSILRGNMSQKLHLQLFKQVLPSISNSTNKNVCSISCNLISLLIESPSLNMNSLLDSTVIVQLDNILELSELKGPSFVSKFSFGFWYSAHKLIKKTNLHKKFNIQTRIQKWGLAHWNNIVSELEEKKEFVELADFIAWLCGIDISPLSYISTFESPSNLYEGTLVDKFHGFDAYSNLQRFIVDQSKYSDTSKKNSRNFDRTKTIHVLGSISGGCTEDLLLKLLTTTDVHLSANDDPRVIPTKFIWTLLLTNLLLVTRDAQALKFFVGAIYLKCTQLIDYFADSTFDASDAIPLIKIINQTNKSVIKDSFWLVVKKYNADLFVSSPFSVNSLIEAIKHSTVDSKKLKGDLFDDDFINVTSNLLVDSLSTLKAIFDDILTFLVSLSNDLGIGEAELIFVGILDMFDSLDDNSLLQGTMALLDYTGEKNLYFNSRPQFLRRLMRMLGEGPLTSHELERNEKTIVVISRFLTSLISVYDRHLDEELNKDWLDMSNWLILCGQKKLILTEWALIEHSKFLISAVHILKDCEDLFFANFHQSTNNMKISLINKLKSTLSGLRSRSTNQDRMELYKKLYSNFEAPQQSISAAATFCLFFASLCNTEGDTSFLIFVAVVFNLIEYSRFPFFVAYIKVSIENILCSCFIDYTPKKLFKMIRIDLLRYWWSVNKGIENFPFEMFEFDSLQSMVELNYKEITAFCVATKGDKIQSESYLSKIAKYKNTEIQNIVIDSFALIISLSYTECGIKNEVHEVLKKILGKLYSEQFRLRLPLIVLEVISFLDVSDEGAFSTLQDGSPIAENLIPREASLEFEPVGTVISFKTGNELLKSIIEKYLKSEKVFWEDKKVVYFFIRRISLKLTNAKTIQDKYFTIRRMKLIIIKSHSRHERITLIPIIELLFETLCPLVNDCQIGDDVCEILSCCEISTSDRSISLILNLLTHLAKRSSIESNSSILNILQSYVVLSDDSERKVIFLAIINKLKGLPFICTINNIEEFINAKHQFEKCRINGSFEEISFLLSFIFPKGDIITTRTTEAVVSYITEIEGDNFFSLLDSSFFKWCGKYIAEYYLSGNENLKPASEVPNTDPVICTTKLDNLLNLALDLSTNNETKANVEALVGVLMWKYDINKSEVMKYINFTEVYQKFLNFLLPIDFHSSILLNSRDDEILVQMVSLEELTKPVLSSCSFEDWTTRAFLLFITEIARYTSIAPLFSNLVLKVPSFANEAFPELTCLYLGLKGNEAISDVCSIINFLVDTNFEKKLATTKATEYSSLLIRIVLAIRFLSKHNEPVFERLYSKLDHIKLFKVAALQEPSTSLMLLEDNLSADNPIVKDTEFRKQELLNSQTKLLQKIYESVDDDDMVYGLPIEPSLKFAIKMLNKETDQVKFSSSMYDSGLTLSNIENPANTGLIHSMMDNGLMGISKLVSDGMTNSEFQDESAYEWAWKLNSWDIPATSESEALTENKVIYKTLKQLQDYPTNFKSICSESIIETFKSKKNFSEKRNWMRAIASVVSIHDLTTSWHSGSSLLTNLNSFDSKTAWFEEAHDLEAVENILLSRRAILQVLTSSTTCSPNKEEQSWLYSMKELIRYNNITRYSDRFLQKSLNSTMLLNDISEVKFTNSLPILQEFVKKVVKFQSACTLWSQGETSIPVAILRDIKNGAPIGEELGGELLDKLFIPAGVIDSLLVEWVSESRQELPSSIMSRYINPLLDQLIPEKNNSKIYERFARFCEKQLKSRTLQDNLKRISSLIQSRKDEKEELKTHYNKKVVNHAERTSIQRYYGKLKALYEQDLQELEVLEATRDELSDKAVQFYLKSIDTNGQCFRGETNGSFIDENVDKFFAIWLEFSSKESLNTIIRDELLMLPSYKLVSWCPQLISRISNDSTEFQKSLQQLILRICEDHPYHSLYNLISLTRHDPFAKFNPTSTIAAKSLWNKLRNGLYNNDTLRNIETFCDHAIKLAEIKASKGKSFQLDKARGDLDFSWWISNLPSIPPPTLELQIDLSLKYKNVPTLASIDPKIEIATSGLSLPKIAKFLLSDGSSHKMLLKHGADDLRQDSIMEQVFEKVNQMFWKDKETRKRNLRVRTYKAVPLGPQNGIIEFVPNSKALIDVVRPYHQIRDKMKVEVAREKMKKCQAESKAKRVAVYEDITKEKIQPVLRHFFLDSFTTPERWFQSRILYTHGIASTSIVGYMLGLGDRHCNNILLDKETGEPIHIDLGVAFDQGKRLPIPETVPFRLTRDIVDGFGITGVEGSFRKASEHSFRLLRNNKDHILAILDVLRWDPLYSWSLSPLRKHKLQDEALGDQGYGVLTPAQSHEDGSEAGRAINGVADKLIGGGLSVEAVVRELIQESTSDDNLALIYCGWCPFF